MIDFSDAFDDMIQNEKWKNKYYKANLRKDWEALFGPVVNKYTEDISIVNKKLVLKISSSAMRQELFNERKSIIQQINNHYKEQIITEIHLK